MESVVGRVFAGRYKVVEPIGTGGMSSVFKAIDERIKRPAAIKFLLPKYVADADAMRRFEREAKAASKLDHANIVRVYEFGVVESGEPYLVMEYVSGRPLSEIVKESGRLDQVRTIRIMLQACDALAQAHEKGVVHRDLKPSNIMILDNDVVKIVDFGIAKVLSQEDTAPIALTQTGDVFGSPPYMSPEQGLGREIDARSDLYSLGCVMYECLTGSPPFMGDTALATLIKHQSEPPLSLEASCFGEQFPEEIEKIVAKLLAKLPRKRYQAAADLKLDLLDYEKGNLDIARFLKEPVAEPVPGRQDLSDFFSRVHRSSISKLDHVRMENANTPLDWVINIFLGGVVLFGILLLFIVAIGFFAHSQKPVEPDPIVQSTEQDKTFSANAILEDHETKSRVAYFRQILDSKFPRLVLNKWNYSKEEWKALSQIPDLRYLDAAGSPLNAQFLKSLNHWKLIDLSFAGCHAVSTKEVSAVSGLTSLRRLDLSDTDVSDLSCAVMPCNLDTLDLRKTMVSDRGLANLAQRGMKNLRVLNLQSTRVTGAGLASLRRFPALETVTLSASTLTDIGCKNLAAVPRLRCLSFSLLSGDVKKVANLRRVRQLQQLNVDGLFPDAELKTLQTDLPTLLIEHH